MTLSKVQVLERAVNWALEEKIYQGLCYALDETPGGCDLGLEIELIMMKWPGYSGESAFPVPGPEGLDPEKAFNDGVPGTDEHDWMWNPEVSEYAAKRWEMIEFIHAVLVGQSEARYNLTLNLFNVAMSDEHRDENYGVCCLVEEICIDEHPSTRFITGTNEVLGELSGIICQWPGWSGDHGFPIPSPDLAESHEDYYNLALHDPYMMWDRDHSYGAKRWELVEFIRNKLKERETHES